MSEATLANDADLIVVDEQSTATIEIANEGSVAITEENTTVITVGIQGPPSALVVGGYGFAVETPIPGDVLMFDGSAWANINKQTISDGGNF